MDVLAGPLLAAATLLVAGGAPKVLAPADTARALRAMRLPVGDLGVRLLGLAEMLSGIAVVISPGRPTAVVVALWYAAFTVVVVLALRSDKPLATCGCFGGTDTPPTYGHLVLVTAASVSAAVFALDPSDNLFAGQPWLGLPLLMLAALTAWFGYLVMSRLAVLR